MSGKNSNSRRHGARALTWACLVLVPVLAFVALGSGLGSALTSESAPVPSGLMVAETRDFASQGDQVAVSAKPIDGSIDQFMDGWQNTVRRAPSPRR